MSQADFVTRGQALVSAGQYQEAVKVCRMGLLGRPTTVEGRVVLGQALLALKRYDEVLAEMRVALELDHGSVSAQVLKGEALLRKGDGAGALDVLQHVRALAPADPRIAALIREGEAASARARPPAPRREPLLIGSEDDDDEDLNTEDEAAHYTRPTSLSLPGPRRGPASDLLAAVPGTPPPNVLAVGDRSGTMEVDPSLDGVEAGDDDDFGDIAAPPSSRGRNRDIGGPRGQVMAAGRSPAPLPRRPKAKSSKEISTVELEDDELIEVTDPAPRRPAKPSAPPPIQAPAPPRLAQVITAKPHVIEHGPMPAARPQPALPPPAAAPPLSPLQQRSAAEVDAILGGAVDPIPAWGPPPGQAPAPPPPRPAADLDPHLAALFAEQGAPVRPTPAPGEQSQASARALKTGMRRTRSRFSVVLWIVIGAAMIGGGVFAGFQIRAARLDSQIAAAREEAVALAKADTWLGWSGARDRLASIAEAASTAGNRAALARARALVAFEFGDGLAEAAAAAAALGGAGGLDAELAAAFVALARYDAKAAAAAADRALAAAANDPAALYVQGHAQLLAHDAGRAIESFAAAHAQEPRPLYAIALARAHAELAAWDDALVALDKALAAAPDHPGALIERALILAASNRVAAAGVAAEARGQLAKVVAEAARPRAEQPRGVAPLQASVAQLALAQLDFARGDKAQAEADVAAALATVQRAGGNDQRFGELIVETLYATNRLPQARSAAARILEDFGTSLRTRLVLAQVALAMGKPADALDVLAKSDLGRSPRALAVRGLARLGARDLDAAKADLDAALELAPRLELAIIGRTWLDLEANELDAARKRIEAAWDAATATPGLAAAYAAVLRRTGERKDREQARAILDKAVAGPPTSDLPRAQLERARVSRDLGDLREARKAYEEASREGDVTAQLESGLIAIEDRDPGGGRATLDLLLKNQGDTASATLVLETARARMLTGDHAGAEPLLERAAKLPDVTRWILERERGRLYLRKGDYAAAAQAFQRALEGSGADAETLLLAADAAVDGKQPKLVDKVKALAPERLGKRPEATVITGKLALGDERWDDALRLFVDAAKQLDEEKATPRRQALANFGKAVAAYQKGDDPVAKTALELVTEQDPSIFAAHLYLADMLKDGDPKRAFGAAQKAVTYNPALVAAWELYGTIAHKLRKRKELAEAITRVGELEPKGESLSRLQALR